MQIINNYHQFISGESARDQLRNLGRKLIIGARSLAKNISNSSGWIRFPYYHHVFDDERAGFERQMKYFKNYGDLISMDDACAMVQQGKPINGRYFCVSFDDGFLSCFTNMMNITYSLDVPVIIYLPTDFIGLDVNKEADQKKIESFYEDQKGLVPFLKWNQCRMMLKQKVSFGSHTCSHANLAKITDADIESELIRSKKKIEEELQTPCNHFACPWGRPDIDFFPERTSTIARAAGYTSFATTARGKTTHGADLFVLKRDHVLANWENFQLRYFFSL